MPALARYRQRNNAATQIAVEDVNADGGVVGRKVEMVVRDSAFKPEVAKRKATELMYAVQLERTYSKKQILALYLTDLRKPAP